MAIEREIEVIQRHKDTVRRYFRMAPQYRYQRTVIEEKCDDLARVLGVTIKVVWGARGHSELAEIEHSWNFIKAFIKKMNPRNAKETTSLFQRAQVLDFNNRALWRENVLLSMSCYVQFGYFNAERMKEAHKMKDTTLSFWFNWFDSIKSKYSFSHTIPQSFREVCYQKFVKQLSYNEIQDL